LPQLERELEAQEYCGSYSLLMQALQPWRGPRPPPEPGRGRRRGRPRVKRVNVRWLCLRPPEQLEAHEFDAVQDILANDGRLACGYELLQRFRRLIARRSTSRTWSGSSTWRSARTRCSETRRVAPIARVASGNRSLPWEQLLEAVETCGVENPAEPFPNIVRWLVKHSYSDSDIGRVLGANTMRVLEQV